MNTLILDCSAGMKVYLINGEKVLSHIDDNQKKHTDELLLVVDNLLSQENLKSKDLDNICVCIGPGSFTGIRVAVAVAKGLATGTGAKMYVCSNFDIYSSENKNKAIYILEGFSDNVYVRVLENQNILDSCEKINNIIDKIKNDYLGYEIFVQNEKLQNLLKDNYILSKIPENNTIFQFNLKINNEKPIEMNQILPIYLRASQAEIERAEKLKKAKINE